MAGLYTKFLLIVFSLVFVSVSYVNLVHADTTPTPDPNASPTPTGSSSNSGQIQQLEQQINDLQGKISDLQGQEKTLSNTIAVMDDKIQLSENEINVTKQKIVNLNTDISATNTQISSLNGSITDLTKLLISRIVATYEQGDTQKLDSLLASQNVGDYLSRASYVKVVQDHDQQLLFSAQQAKNSYLNLKNIREQQKQQVEALQASLEQQSQELDQEKQAKQTLLAQTQGDEASYQRQLAQTEAQLASFSSFTTSQGGASLLSGQTVCDSWGCYYNQRDSQWGGVPLNGTQYSIASDGCLLTSLAMVYTHYGHRDVTPLSINSNSSNFSGIPPALLRFSVSANGVSSQRVSADIDSTLASGNPVIVGISYDGGGYPDHFVVFVSGSGGDYIMNDPFTPNGHNISFRGRYPSVRIVETDKIVGL